jgi:hypothetical protein
VTYEEIERELIGKRTLAGIERAEAKGWMGGRKTLMSIGRIRVASAVLREGRPRGGGRQSAQRLQCHSVSRLADWLAAGPG